MKKIKKIFCLVCVVLITGCSTKQRAIKYDPVKMPLKYGSQVDSGKAELPAWKDFFHDPHLISLIDTALQRNFDLMIALQKVEMANANLRSVKGIRLPEVSANMSSGLRKFGDYTMDGVGNYDTRFSDNINEKQRIPDPLPDYYLGLQTSWEIDLWNKLKSRKQSAVAKFVAGNFGKNLVLTTLISEIASEYYELLALDAERKILAGNIVLQQEALDIVNIQKQAGKGNQLGVELLSAQLLNSESAALELDQRIKLSENKISFLTGSYPQKIERDTSFNDLYLPAKIRNGVPSDLLSNRPDIKQAEFEMHAAKADVKAAKAAFYPSLNINSALGLQAFNIALLIETPASLAYNIAGSLVAPLVNRRMIKAQLLSSEANYAREYISYHKTIVNGFYEVYNSMLQMKNNEAMFELKNKEVDILKQSIGTSKELFKTGRATYLEVITAQKNTLQSQRELLDLKKKQVHYAIGMYKALGGGWK